MACRKGNRAIGAPKAKLQGSVGGNPTPRCRGEAWWFVEGPEVAQATPKAPRQRVRRTKGDIPEYPLAGSVGPDPQQDPSNSYFEGSCCFYSLPTAYDVGATPPNHSASWTNPSSMLTRGVHSRAVRVSR